MSHSISVFAVLLPCVYTQVLIEREYFRINDNRLLITIAGFISPGLPIYMYPTLFLFCCFGYNECLRSVRLLYLKGAESFRTLKRVFTIHEYEYSLYTYRICVFGTIAVMSESSDVRARESAELVPII